MHCPRHCLNKRKYSHYALKFDFFFFQNATDQQKINKTTTKLNKLPRKIYQIKIYKRPSKIQDTLEVELNISYLIFPVKWKNSVVNRQQVNHKFFLKLPRL